MLKISPIGLNILTDFDENAADFRNLSSLTVTCFSVRWGFAHFTFTLLF